MDVALSEMDSILRRLYERRAVVPQCRGQLRRMQCVCEGQEVGSRVSSKPTKKPATGVKKKPAVKAAKSTTLTKSATATKAAPRAKLALTAGKKTKAKAKAKVPPAAAAALSLLEAVQQSIAAAATDGQQGMSFPASEAGRDDSSIARGNVDKTADAGTIEPTAEPVAESSAAGSAATSSFASLIAEFERRNRAAAGQAAPPAPQPVVQRFVPTAAQFASRPAAAVMAKAVTAVAAPASMSPLTPGAPSIAAPDLAPAGGKLGTPPRTLYRHVAPTKPQSNHQDYRYSGGGSSSAPQRQAPQPSQPSQQQQTGPANQTSQPAPFLYDARPQQPPAAAPPPPQVYSFGQQNQAPRPFKSAREAFAAPAERARSGSPAEPVAPPRKRFEDLITIDPQPRLTLEYRGCPESCRLIDLFCPIGRGQRALIVSPPKAGKTTLLKDISGSIARNHPDIELIALLVDERPEEVTDFQRHFASLGPKARVIASSNDHGVDKHIAVSTTTIAECKRGVEEGRHIVVVLDSLTRLGRAFNLSRKHASSGRTLSGGLDARALEIPRQIFGAARNTEDAGSLTIIATCLVDTGSRGDEVIFEEFKGSGNMELILDRKISERRMFPAINLAASGTRKEHLMLSSEEIKTMTALRRQLLAMPPHVQVERLLAAMKRFATNEALVAAVSGQPGMTD